MNNDLQFFIPADIKKSEDGTGEMRICGFASTPDLDRHGESVVQKGLDIQEFLNYGFFNYNHDNSYILGYPDKEATRITKKGMYVEGHILPSPMGVRLWDTAVALKKSNADRKMGFSIEGKVLARDRHGKITKAKVYNVAITPTPVNPNATWDCIVKSMTTTTGQVLIPESLEHVSHFISRVKDGEPSSITVLENFTQRLNKSTEPSDIKLYLSMFKGFYGDELDTKTNQVIKELEGTKNGF